MYTLCRDPKLGLHTTWLKVTQKHRQGYCRFVVATSLGLDDKELLGSGCMEEQAALCRLVSILQVYDDKLQVMYVSVSV